MWLRGGLSCIYFCESARPVSEQLSASGEKIKGERTWHHLEYLKTWLHYAIFGHFRGVRGGPGDLLTLGRKNYWHIKNELVPVTFVNLIFMTPKSIRELQRVIWTESYTVHVPLKALISNHVCLAFSFQPNHSFQTNQTLLQKLITNFPVSFSFTDLFLLRMMRLPSRC